MKQYTVTFRTATGAARFRFITAVDREDMRSQVSAEYPGCTILKARENVPALVTIEAAPADDVTTC